MTGLEIGKVTGFYQLWTLPRRKKSMGTKK